MAIFPGGREVKVQLLLGSKALISLILSNGDFRQLGENILVQV